MKKFYPLLLLIPLVDISFYLLEDSMEKEPGDTPTGRMEWEVMRLADPRTGEIPADIRQRELEFASTLPEAKKYNDKSGSQEFTLIGPWNVGGRTRALAIDISDPSTYFAGGVSGGMWRSKDEGITWSKVSDPMDHAATSCIVQDTRAGKTSTWYYGSGETIGNSASKSFSAYYHGSGMWKSTNGGDSWQHLTSTETPVNKGSDWEAIFAVAIDPSRNDSDIVFAAVKNGIMRSNDGGETWSNVLPTAMEASFTDIQVSTTGICYAVISSDATQGSGFWRSTDGLNWTRISSSNFPASHQRTVLDIAPSDEDLVFFFSNTAGSGANGASLWKYEYLSGNGSGSGGDWTNLTPYIPDTNLNLFNGYCMVLKVKPDNPDVIFMGGNNLYRSLTGFTDSVNVHWVGGYRVFGDSTYNTRTGRQHPDQQNMFFHPNDPDFMLSSTDGGVHKTLKCADTLIQWISLNTGYVTSQFYGIGIDHGTPGSKVVLGGLQDQGTYWTNTSIPDEDWVSIRGADGAYVWVEDGGGAYYVSTQYANIRRMILDSSGEKLHNKKVMPPDLPTGSGNGWLFVHPFTLDPVDNNIMYLPYGGEVWKNDSLMEADSGNLDPWREMVDVGGTITAITASEDEQGTVFFGTSGGSIYRVRNAHTPGNKFEERIDNTLNGGGYTSCIAVDPNDNEKIIVVYSNYNVVSLWYTENAGADWEEIEGNLVGEKDDGLPDFLYYIGNGPSIRWAEIIPTEKGNRYFIGTSVGLFSTNKLDGDSTVWLHEGGNSIGNVVVDMLDYRHSDQFLAVGTHGNGIYTTTVYPNYIGIDEGNRVQNTDIQIFPNPASDVVSITYDLVESSNISIDIYDVRGRMVKEISNGNQNAGRQRLDLDVSNFDSGIYLIQINGEDFSEVKRLVVE